MLKQTYQFILMKKQDYFNDFTEVNIPFKKSSVTFDNIIYKCASQYIDYI